LLLLLTENGSSSSSNGGIIALAIILPLVVIGILAFGYYRYRLHRRKAINDLSKTGGHGTEMSPATSPAPGTALYVHVTSPPGSPVPQ
jgi:hypothetical protein